MKAYSSPIIVNSTGLILRKEVQGVHRTGQIKEGRTEKRKNTVSAIKTEDLFRNEE